MHHMRVNKELGHRCSSLSNGTSLRYRNIGRLHPIVNAPRMRTNLAEIQFCDQAFHRGVNPPGGILLPTHGKDFPNEPGRLPFVPARMVVLYISHVLSVSYGATWVPLMAPRNPALAAWLRRFHTSGKSACVYGGSLSAPQATEPKPKPSCLIARFTEA